MMPIHVGHRKLKSIPGKNQKRDKILERNSRVGLLKILGEWNSGDISRSENIECPKEMIKRQSGCCKQTLCSVFHPDPALSKALYKNGFKTTKTEQTNFCIGFSIRVGSSISPPCSKPGVACEQCTICKPSLKYKKRAFKWIEQTKTNSCWRKVSVVYHSRC